MGSLRRVLAHLKSLLRHPANYASSYRPFRQSTDHEHRQDPSKLRPDRDERKRLIAGLIADGSNVIGFGAARQVLTRHSGQGYTDQHFDLLKGDTVYINGDGETSRDFCYIANAVQANLLAATSESAEARNQVYNVAVGDRTTLNALFGLLRDNLAAWGVSPAVQPI